MITVGQQHPGETLCWLTALSQPVLLRNHTTPEQGWATVVVGGGARPIAPPPPSADAIVFGDGGWQAGQGGSFGSEFFVENVLELLDSPGEGVGQQ